MQNLCLPRIFETVKKHKAVISIYFIIVILLAAALGFKKYKSAGVINPDIQKTIAEYEEGLKSRDQAIAENQSALEDARKTADNLQTYVDNSIYMKLDSEAVNLLNLQYVLECTEETNLGGVQNSLTAYINDGELISDIQKLSSEEETKYLKEVLSFSIRGQDLSIAVMHYSDEKLHVLAGQIEQCLNNYIPVLISNYGPLGLVKVNEEYSVKSDAGVVNTQNGNTNNLRSYKNTVADLEGKAASLVEGKNNYIDNNCPDMELENPVKAALKAFIGVFIIGIGILAIVLFFIISFGNIVKNRTDIEYAGLGILGIYNKKKGFDPDPKAIALNIKLMADKLSTSRVFLNCLLQRDEALEAVAQIKTALNESNLEVDEGYSLFSSGEELEKAVKDSLCILIIKNGYTKISDIKDCKKMCDKFGIKLSSVIDIE